MNDPISLPDSWGLTKQQDDVIGGLIDNSGEYMTAATLCRCVYSEVHTGPAPAKLRVLIQRCRELVNKFSGDRVSILVKRNSGWKITETDADIMRKIISGH